MTLYDWIRSCAELTHWHEAVDAGSFFDEKQGYSNENEAETDLTRQNHGFFKINRCPACLFLRLQLMIQLMLDSGIYMNIQLSNLWWI